MEGTRTSSITTAEFETKRKKMIAWGMRLGFTHPIVLKASQELDALHNALLNKEVAV